MTSNNKTPPVMGPDTDYDQCNLEWTFCVEISYRHINKKKQALAVTPLSLSGKARQTGLDIPVEDLNKDEGMTVS